MSNLSYGDFAFIYDRLTDDVEYEKRADYIENIICKHFGKSAELLCDLGCGTGTMCNLMSDKGYDVIGIDSSESMLDVAMQKSSVGKILYLNQDMTDFELYGTVDVFISMLDSVNYVTEQSELQKMFSLVNNYLNPNGIFIFDVNSKFKFENILGDNTYTYEADDIFYTWENYYEDELLDIYLNFFIKNNSGSYDRMKEHHVQRYYSLERLKKMADKSNLSVEAVYGDLSFEKPKENEERIFFVLKKCEFWLFSSKQWKVIKNKLKKIDNLYIIC